MKDSRGVRDLSLGDKLAAIGGFNAIRLLSKTWRYKSVNKEIPDGLRAARQPILFTLWHGEMHALKLLYERERASLPDPGDCLFFATHEPCSLCLSAITWGGYDNFYYLFSHEDSRDSFAIPHDIRIIREVFDTGSEPDRPLYNRENAFWTSHSVPRMIASLDRGNRERLLGRMDDIGALYADLSARYQQAKGGKGIPFA